MRITYLLHSLFCLLLAVGLTGCSPQIPESTLNTDIIIKKEDTSSLKTICCPSGATDTLFAKKFIYYKPKDTRVTVLIDPTSEKSVTLDDVGLHGALLTDRLFIMYRDLRTPGATQSVDLYAITTDAFRVERVSFEKSGRNSDYLNGLLMLGDDRFVYDKRLFFIENESIIPGPRVDYFLSLNNGAPLIISNRQASSGILKCDKDNILLQRFEDDSNEGQNNTFSLELNDLQCIVTHFDYVYNNPGYDEDTFVFMSEYPVIDRSILTLEIYDIAVRRQIAKLYRDRFIYNRNSNQLSSDSKVLQIDQSLQATLTSDRVDYGINNFSLFSRLSIIKNSASVGEIIRIPSLQFIGLSIDNNNLYFLSNQGLEVLNLEQLRL